MILKSKKIKKLSKKISFTIMYKSHKIKKGKRYLHFPKKIHIKDGYRPTFMIVDEIHTMPSDAKIINAIKIGSCKSNDNEIIQIKKEIQ